MSDELHDLVEDLRRRAVEVKNGGKHKRVEVDGKLVGALPVSSSDWRALKNQQLQLERAGVLPKEREKSGEKRGRRRPAAVKPYDGPLYPEGRRPRPKHG